jgi:hypothetical protein
VPATFTLGCKLTYAGPNPPAPKIITATAGDTFPGDISIVSANPQRQPFFQSDTWNFLVLDFNHTPCGPYLTGLAQERIYNRLDWWGNSPPPFGWYPDNPVPTFSMSQAHIFDNHSCDAGNWNAVPIGSHESADQDLRILFTYPAGGTVPCPLRSVSYLITKVDNTNWSEQATLK